MKILIYGAGVLGCNLARDLFRAGKEVTLLARGAWTERIRKNGLRIKDKFSPCVSVSRIPVAAELKPEDRYDVIFVVMRYTQIQSVLETPRASCPEIRTPAPEATAMERAIRISTKGTDTAAAAIAPRPRRFPMKMPSTIT